MNLAALFPLHALPAAAGGADVRGLSADSRAVEKDFVFFAVPGVKADGLGFVPDAVVRGALAVVAEKKTEALPAHVSFIAVKNVRVELALAAARFYPRQPAVIVAVTGTSGKTSVAAFVRQIWTKLGLQAASMGTIGVVAPGGAVYGSLTTPDPVTLHQTLQRLADGGVTHVALEASSHGLDQHRLDGLRLSAGAFTNLSRDHLDYHAGPEDYFAAKLRLFTQLLAPGAAAVIDADGDHSERVAISARERGLKVLTTGSCGADLCLEEAVPDGFTTELAVSHAGRAYKISLPLPGAFQAANALVAAGLCIAAGSAPQAVFSALETLEGAPGRLERVAEYRGAPILIDYAHKPDALEKALRALRPYARKNLIVVFGCGGDRDPGKRPMMGEIAAKNADVVIVTDDNPRSENAAGIRAEILSKAPGAREIGDRGAAIAAAIAMLGGGDLLVIAGKGHETGQTVGDKVLPFSDHEAVRLALKERAA